MILTGRDIKWYIKMGLLTISPLEPEQLQQNGVDLILDDIDGMWKHDWRWFQGFCLGSTRERLGLPNDLMAFVQLRSTWARSGIMVAPTVVDAGFCGNLTLEIVVFKKQKPPIGERFIHLVFAKLTAPAEGYKGKYQGQGGITGPRF